MNILSQEDLNIKLKIAYIKNNDTNFIINYMIIGLDSQTNLSKEEI